MSRREKTVGTAALQLQPGGGTRCRPTLLPAERGEVAVLVGREVKGEL